MHFAKIIIVALPIALVVSGCDQPSNQYSLQPQTPIQDLGDGYDIATISKPSSSSFESVSHSNYLRYKEKDICQIGSYTPSPDQRFIAFQESISGKLYLLDKKDNSRIELAPFPGLVRDFDWTAKVDFLRVAIYDKEALYIQLPRPKSK